MCYDSVQAQIIYPKGCIMAEDKVRIWGTFPLDKAQKMREWAESIGIPQAQFFSMCAWVGAKQVMRVVEPEKVFTPAEWAAIIRSYTENMEQNEKVLEALKEQAAEAGVEFDGGKEDA